MWRECVYKPIRMPDYDYSSPNGYFVTVCTYEKQCFFGEIFDGEMILNEAGIIAHNIWLSIPERFPGVVLDVSVVMPNHFHGLLVITDAYKGRKKADGTDGYKEPLQEMVRTFKAATTHAVHEDGLSLFAWQPRFHDRVIRNERHLEIVQNYIYTNPSRWLDDCFHPSRQTEQPSSNDEPM